MELKERLIEALEAANGDFVSGEFLAAEFGVSRNAVSRASAQLKKDGYLVEGRNNRGYRICENNLKCPPSGILKLIKKNGINLIQKGTVVSTNDLVKKLAETGAPEGTLMIADGQTGGRGRTGKAFFCPVGTGIYMSLLLRPTVSAEDARLITTCAAVAVCRAVERVSGREAKVKWVNDIFIDGKKVCGILTEGAYSMETGTLSFAVLGIGINIYPPREGFGDVTGIAGPLFPNESGGWQMKCRLIAEIVDSFFELYDKLPEKGFVEEYKARSYLNGKQITVLTRGKEIPATAVAVGDDLRLLVRMESGEERWLDSGDVSIIPGK